MPRLREKYIWILIGLGIFAFFLFTFFFTPLFFQDNTPESGSFNADGLGVTLIDIHSEETARHYHVSQLGVYVLATAENSPGYQAGIRSGDQLLSVEDRPILTSSDFTSANNLFTPGQAVHIVVRRGNQQHTLIAQFPAQNTD